MPDIPKLDRDDMRAMLPPGGTTIPTVTQTRKTLNAPNTLDKQLLADAVREEALKYATDAIGVYVAIIHDTSLSAKDRLAAADRLLDRAIGKPVQVAVVDEVKLDLPSEHRAALERLVAQPTPKTIEVKLPHGKE